jgi:hypothetical protein
MKTIVLSLILVTYNFSFAQADREVQVAVENLRLAMIDPTAEQLQKLTSTDLTYGHSSGVMENQAQFIEALVSGKSDFKSIVTSEQTVNMSGKNIALVRHKLKGELAMADGSTNTVNIGVLQVWTKEKGGWKLLARQAFKL